MSKVKKRSLVKSGLKHVKQATLERVLGCTANSATGLACDPYSGLIAYPAGCVVVIFNPKKNKQSHIINHSRKTITCVAFSSDGKYLATGESGHQPAVRLWDVEDKCQVSEYVGHKFAVNCVAFSPTQKYLVSIGSQHDMIVNVWNYKTNTKVASNKVAANVSGLAFSEDGSAFVSVGLRHVKFWYLSKPSKINETIPLSGRHALLGEQKDNNFCAVAYGKGSMSSKIYVVARNGRLCEVNEKRLIDKWVDLRSSQSYTISTSEQYVLVGCSDGVIRVFSALSLNYVATLPRPHHLGVDIAAWSDPSNLSRPEGELKYPDCLALTFDHLNKRVTAIYHDNSVYIWDVSMIKRVGKLRSFLFHSRCIWGLEVYPELEDGLLPPGSFLTCGEDDTIRVWNIDPHVEKKNIYSNECLKVLYCDSEHTNLLLDCDNINTSNTQGNPQGSHKLDKTGLRAIKVSPEGTHLATGDRLGNIRIHDLGFFDQLHFLEAHDSEVLNLEFTDPKCGVSLLSSASRDRLIHLFDVDQDYGLIQTLDDHSSAITAVRFIQREEGLTMLSCGADKSLLFRNVQQDPKFQFVLNKHLGLKTTLYDMDVDQDFKFVATACQDRNVRIYNLKNGKQKKCYTGTIGNDGTLLRVQLDNTGSYVATSCSDKTICLLDFFSGEVLASMFGHSEIITGVKFTNNKKHLITVSGDGCIFVWRLPHDVTEHMRTRAANDVEPEQIPNNLHLSLADDDEARRGTFVLLAEQTDGVHPALNNNNKNDYSFNVGHLPSWAKKQVAHEPFQTPDDLGNPAPPPKGRWAQRVDDGGIVMKSMLDDKSGVQLSLQDRLDRRRFTIEADSLNATKGVPVTNDDELNRDDDVDDFRPKLDVTLTNNLSKRESVDYDEDDDIDGAADKDVIYYNNEKDIDSPDADNTFQVFEGINDNGSECTDPNSTDDTEDEEATTPGDVNKGFDIGTPDQEQFLRENFESLNFEQSLDAGELEILSGSEIMHQRLSISAKFLSRAQQQYLRNIHSSALGQVQENRHNNSVSSYNFQQRKSDIQKSIEDRRKSSDDVGNDAQMIRSRSSMGLIGYRQQNNTTPTGRPDSRGPTTRSQVSKTEMKVEGTSSGGRRSLSRQNSHNDKISDSKKCISRQHSYRDATASSKAKLSAHGSVTSLNKENNDTPPTGNTAYNTGSMKRRRGRLSASLKKQFSSTPDLTPEKELVEVPPPNNDDSVTVSKKNTRRSMPATKETRDPFAGSGRSSSVSRKLPTPPPSDDTDRSLSVATAGEIDISDNKSSKVMNDRKAMPPPSTTVPLSKQNRRKTDPGLSLSQAKNILMGRGSLFSRKSSQPVNKRDSGKSNDTSLMSEAPETDKSKTDNVLSSKETARNKSLPSKVTKDSFDMLDEVPSKEESVRRPTPTASERCLVELQSLYPKDKVENQTNSSVSIPTSPPRTSPPRSVTMFSVAPSIGVTSTTVARSPSASSTVNMTSNTISSTSQNSTVTTSTVTINSIDNEPPANVFREGEPQDIKAPTSQFRASHTFNSPRANSPLKSILKSPARPMSANDILSENSDSDTKSVNVDNDTKTDELNGSGNWILTSRTSPESDRFKTTRTLLSRNRSDVLAKLLSPDQNTSSTQEDSVNDPDKTPTKDDQGTEVIDKRITSNIPNGDSSVDMKQESVKTEVKTEEKAKPDKSKFSLPITKPTTPDICAEDKCITAIKKIEEVKNLFTQIKEQDPEVFKKHIDTVRNMELDLRELRRGSRGPDPADLPDIFSSLASNPDALQTLFSNITSSDSTC